MMMIDDANKAFFDLLKLGMGLTDNICLPLMDDRKWVKIFETAKKQTVLGIMADAIKRLPDDVVKPSYEVMIRLVGYCVQLEKTNRRINREVLKWIDFFEEKGFSAVLLKGQGIAQLYPSPLRRTPGDIDLWVIGKEAKIRNLVKKELKPSEILYHNSVVHADNNIELEIHTRPSFLYNPVRNFKTQRLFKKWAKEAVKVNLPENVGAISIPSDNMNRIFLLLHLYRHVFSEGIGLRQMADYAMLLNKGCTDGDKMQCKIWLKSLGLERFAASVMYLMKVVFDLNDKVLITEVDEKGGAILLKECLEGGNFGIYNPNIDRNIKHDSLKSFIVKNKRNFRFIGLYTNEVIWAPYFKFFHYLWRRMV